MPGACSPARKKSVLVIAPGYPQEGYHLRKKIRKPVEEVVTYNRY
jgi:nitroreductase